MNLNVQIENLKGSHKQVFGFGHFTVRSKLRVLYFVLDERKNFGQTSNYWKLSHATPGEIGTIVRRIILWICYPNFSQMCHGVRICHKSTYFVDFSTKKKGKKKTALRPNARGYSAAPCALKQV